MLDFSPPLDDRIRAASAETIKIGVFGPFTGDAAATGAAEKEAVDLAIKEKNAAGGIRGKQIEAVYADDAGKPEEAVNVAKRLTARDNVLIMIGSISSPASLAASQVAAQSQTAQIVVSGTAQKITTQGNKWVFRSPVPDTKLAGDLAAFIHEKFPNVKKIAFLYVNDDFGRGGFETFKAGRDKSTASKSSPKSAMPAATSTSPRNSAASRPAPRRRWSNGRATPKARWSPSNSSR